MVCHTRINLFRTAFARFFFLLLGAVGLSAQTLSMVSGNGQIVAQQFQTNSPLVVQATGANGKPAPGVTVNWAVTGQPGSLSSTSNTTDSNGQASVIFTGTTLNTLLSYAPSTVTASAGSSSVNFVVTTVQSLSTVAVQVNTPAVGATLTAPSGTTIPAAVVVQVFAEGQFQSGQGIPNVGLRVGNAQDPTVAPPAACNALAGIALTDSSGTATCNLTLTGPPGSTQLVGITGEFNQNPTFTLDITPGATCKYTLSASSQSFSSSGGPGSVNVVTTSGCAWTAVSNANFVNISSGANGTGNGTVSYTVAANTGASRSGTLTIAGQTYTVNQSAASTTGGGGGLSITTAQNLPPGNVGANYSTTLAATGGQQPYTWSINGSLPAGLSLTPSTGVISGTPSSSGVYGFTATVTDAANNHASENLSLTISGSSSGSFTITNVSFAQGTVGQPYSQPLTTANFCSTPFSHNVNFSVTAGSLPGGLSITSNPDSSHSITGTPQSSGAFQFTLTATDPCGHTATQSFTIVIGGPPGSQSMTVSSTSLSFTAQNGSPAPADQTLTIGANTGTLNYSVALNTNSGSNWLVAKSAITGTTPGSFTVGVANYSTLAPGPYTGSVVISSSASNSPVIVKVTLTVNAAPSLILQGPSLIQLSQVASAAPKFTPVTVEQLALASGAGPAHFTATALTNDGSNWLNITPADGVTPQTLTASIDTGGLKPGNYTGTAVIRPDAGTAITVNFTVTVTQQLPALVSLVNGASFLNGPVSPGEIVTVFGTALGPLIPANVQLDQSGKVAANLAGTQLLFDGIPAAMIYSAAGQISAIVPYEVAGNATTSVTAEYLGLSSGAVKVPVTDAAPGIFVLNSSGQGAILNQDGSVNSSTNGADPGSVISIYATGEGQTNPAGVDGDVTGSQLPAPLLPVTVQIAGQNTQVLYAGAAPGEPSGVLQVNAMIPPSVPHGTSVPVVITVGTATSQTGVTVAIK